MSDNPRACPWCGADDWQEGMDGPGLTGIPLHDLVIDPLVAVSGDSATMVAASIGHSIDECQRCGCVVSL